MWEFVVFCRAGYQSGSILPQGSLESMSTDLPASAEIVIIGGGVVGCSVAYHLTQMGKRDVVLVEQGRLSCGTTWHAAGLVGQLRAHQNMTRLVQHSIELYSRLEAETGLATGWRQCGSIIVARTPERMTLLRRVAASATAQGVPCDVISVKAAAERYPIMATRRPPRRVMASERRQGEPGRRDAGAGEGRPHARRDASSRGPRSRASA